MRERACEDEGLVFGLVGDVFGCPFLERSGVFLAMLFAPEQAGAAGGRFGFDGQFFEGDSIAVVVRCGGLRDVE